MFKILLLLSATFFISTTSICMAPYVSPENDDSAWIWLSQGWVERNCPNCGMLRIFPSDDFIRDRCRSVSDEELFRIAQSICNYVGDIIPGRYCEFCGCNIPK